MGGEFGVAGAAVGLVGAEIDGEEVAAFEDGMTPTTRSAQEH